jgi:hypothetical protein
LDILHTRLSIKESEVMVAVADDGEDGDDEAAQEEDPAVAASAVASASNVVKVSS